MNVKISVFVICVEAIIYLLLYNFDDCTFKFKKKCLRICYFLIFGQNVVTTLSFRRRRSKKKIIFYNVLMTSVLGLSINVVAITSYFCICTEKTDLWSCLVHCLVHLSGTVTYFLAANSTGLWFNLFLCSGNRKTGYNIYMLRWYFKTILNSL